MLCPRHLIFKDRFRNVAVDISCKCLEQPRGCCKYCKTKCFNLNFVADKIKVSQLSDVPSGVELQTIAEYLKVDIKGLLFLHFCKNCMEIACNLANPNEFDLIRVKKVWGNRYFRFI